MGCSTCPPLSPKKEAVFVAVHTGKVAGTVEARIQGWGGSRLKGGRGRRASDANRVLPVEPKVPLRPHHFVKVAKVRVIALDTTFIDNFIDSLLRSLKPT